MNTHILTIRYLLVLILITVLSCNNNIPEVKEQPAFEVHTYQLSINTNLYRAYLFKRDIVAIDEDKNIYVLDSMYRHKVEAEKKLNNQNIASIEQRNDTLFFRKYKDGLWYNHFYYCTESDYDIENTVEEIDRSASTYFSRNSLYSDKSYLVYSGCAGEFGGTIFFKEKATEDVYGYPVTCPKQVIRTDSFYLISESLAHLIGSSCFYKIHDPKKLYYTPNKLHTSMNWWITDTNILREIYDTTGKYLKKRGVEIYGDVIGALTILTFKHNRQLYSIQSVYDSTGYRYQIVEHENDSLKRVQLIELNNIAGGYSFPFIYKNASLGLTWGHGTSCSDTICIDRYASDLFIIKGNKIDILRYYKENVRKSPI